MNDPRRAERLRGFIARDLLRAQVLAARNVLKLLSGEDPESIVSWKEASVRARLSLAVAQGSMAAQRAEQLAQTPRELGVIVVHKRLEDTPQNRIDWEADAAKLSEPRAIEAVATTKVTNGS